ncbi:50S ribosomal protein L9 [Paradevosia shaoguanensis]|uniref:Large ribosomal subunit protein bL9 n=1 Tax=Paradevosia shaoguanensis TaxID=1335043 RepID=A0AA41UFN4_9HYPH|nr:50S ribosomal protein L9 [Paradevosia shaoguanensis]MCF1742113.1 50S ribosomal protein L9 [Paradevosia shaoguanensis]MCI0126596.1 50S ribosomal protein L9 [Paradevosia shaoguanensis]CDP52397.1 LSU ribosomal protein L9p [Devosia sp. DBB001]
MKVILLERVGRTGHIGDEVTVKDGYARNFLLPQGKALRATEANRAKFASERANIEKRNAERREAAAGIASGLNGHIVTMIRQAGETGQLYGSVSSRDVADALIADGFSVARSQIDLANPIKTVGLHSVALHLHAEVEVSIKVNVARSEDEAARQAQGEDLTVVDYGDDEAAAAFQEEREIAAEDEAAEEEAEANQA